MNEQLWSITEAAEQTGMSREAVRKRLRGGDFPGAFKTGNRWEIPMQDLLAVGWDVQQPEHEATARRIAELEATVADLRKELEKTQRELVDAYRRLADQAPRQIESAVASAFQQVKRLRLWS